MRLQFLSENSRIFTAEQGSVWVKALAGHLRMFTVLSYHPAERRIKAKACQLESVGAWPVVRLTTVFGQYCIGQTQFVRLASGEVAGVTELRPGVALQSGVLKNVEGHITIETIYRDIWLDELVDADMQGIPLKLEERPDRPPEPKQHLLKIEQLGMQPCYRALVDCATPDEPSPASGHNLLIWPDGTSCGSGIFVY